MKSIFFCYSQAKLYTTKMYYTTCLAQGRVSNTFPSVHLRLWHTCGIRPPHCFDWLRLAEPAEAELEIAGAHTHYTLFFQKMHSEPHLCSVIVASLGFGKANLQNFYKCKYHKIENRNYWHSSSVTVIEQQAQQASHKCFNGLLWLQATNLSLSPHTSVIFMFAAHI